MKPDPEEQALLDDIVRQLDEIGFNTSEHSWELLEQLSKVLRAGDINGAVKLVDQLQLVYKGYHLLSGND